ncbi:hypothetical protein DFW101_2331 [Solidesulfovibrio carbinoliphilus subsp. oakridgensis]|uniref:Uncharacterized protein n=1 Tax=Solidesulfovibrio carbinoliphilus subsp. oakridgensis TaxID=694327 RepID=G7QAZ4_9BACT|nr:hypothetical protein DFW101_2331 [Solidesulfovibrio carbinoliphilus subsp. oakridgensis]
MARVVTRPGTRIVGSRPAGARRPRPLRPAHTRARRAASHFRTQCPPCPGGLSLRLAGLQGRIEMIAAHAAAAGHVEDILLVERKEPASFGAAFSIDATQFIRGQHRTGQGKMAACSTLVAVAPTLLQLPGHVALAKMNGVQAPYFPNENMHRMFCRRHGQILYRACRPGRPVRASPAVYPTSLNFSRSKRPGPAMASWPWDGSHSRHASHGRGRPRDAGRQSGFSDAIVVGHEHGAPEAQARMASSSPRT